MSPAAPSRRLATVLFLDVVGSTHVASDLGDARWRTLLSRFRKVVRGQLRLHHGTEENFTGDGFLATFAEPAEAIAAGAGIVRGVQDLGIDVRVGLHTGEVETIEGHLGGMGVHIGARVMSLAGPAEVLVTSTVKDVVRGSPIVFEDLAVHELKGIPGTWSIVAVRSIEGQDLPSPIDPADAVARLESIESDAGTKRRRRKVGLVAAAVALVVAVGAAMAFAGRDGAEVAAPSGSPEPETSLLKVDATAQEVISSVDDGLITDHLWGALTIENGTLFQRTPSEVRTRDLASGDVVQSFDVGEHDTSAIGFGSEWLGSSSGTGSLVQVDLLSGQDVGSLDIEGGAPVVGVGPDAVWFVSTTGELGRVDPITLEAETWPSRATAPSTVVPFSDYVWICDCENRQIFRFDVETETFTRFEIPEEAHLVGPRDGSAPEQLWLVDPGANTVTPLDPETAERGRSIGFEGTLADAQIGLGRVWVAAADHVYVLDETDDEAEVVDIPMPQGFFASSVAIDAEAGTVWIGTCGCPFE